MSVHRKTLIGLLAVAGLASWLLVAGPGDVMGFDTGTTGMVLLTGTAWVALYLVSRIPRSDTEGEVAPGEWKAWVGVGFMVVAVSYFLAHVGVFVADGPWNNPDANAVGRNLVILLIANWRNNRRQVQEVGTTSVALAFAMGLLGGLSRKR